MLDIRFLCSHCYKVSSYRIAINKKFTIEPVNCEYCESYIGDFIHTPDKEVKK